MSISNAMLLRFASGLPHGFWDRQRFELVPNIILRVCCKKMCKQSSQQSDQSCFFTNTRTTHTRQNKPYRLGAVRAGVVGARGRCWPAATVPVAVVFPCGVCCCIAELSYFSKFQIFLLDLCVGTAPQNMGTAPGFWRALPLCGDKTFPKYV